MKSSRIATPALAALHSLRRRDADAYNEAEARWIIASADPSLSYFDKIFARYSFRIAQESYWSSLCRYHSKAEIDAEIAKLELEASK